jgi:hypothetical protein
MTKKILSHGLVLAAILLTMYACSGAGTTSTGTNPLPQPTAATLRVLSTGTLASGALIGGVEVTALLPTGVTVKATPDTTNPSELVTNAGVVVASGVSTGVNTNTIAIYTAATATAPGKVVITVLDANGFGTGEVATVKCDIASGSTPKAADFSLSGFKAVNLDGAPISGLSAGITVDIK